MKLLVLLSIIVSVVSKPRLHINVVGGIPGSTTEIKDSIEALSQVSLQRKYGSHFCSGTIVSNNRIITAAHCLSDVVGNSPAGIRIAWGGIHLYNLSNSILLNSESKIVWINGMNGYHGLDHDVAAIVLANPINEWNNMSAVTGSIDVNTNCKGARFRRNKCPPLIASGWGYTEEWGYELSDEMNIVELTWSSNCAGRAYSEYRNRFPPKDRSRILCAGSKGFDMCRGDSGAGGFINGELVGVVSFGNGCARKQGGVFHKVGYYPELF